jgi:hypothetical protein
VSGYTLWIPGPGSYALCKKKKLIMHRHTGHLKIAKSYTYALHVAYVYIYIYIVTVCTYEYMIPMSLYTLILLAISKVLCGHVKPISLYTFTNL